MPSPRTATTICGVKFDMSMLAVLFNRARLANNLLTDCRAIVPRHSVWTTLRTTNLTRGTPGGKFGEIKYRMLCTQAV